MAAVLTRVRRRRLFGALLLALSLLAVVPGSALAFNKAIWGPVDQNGVNQFPLYHQLGVSIYETDLFWSDVALTRPSDPTDPTDPAYQWPTDIQQAIQQAAVFHMRIMLQIITTPRWANGQRPPNWAPTNPADVGAFATAAAREYPSVHLWMIWGEANRAANFEPIALVRPGRKLTPAQKYAPHLYARMLDDAYGALKAVSRKNLVIGGDTYIGGYIRTLPWIQNLRLPNGRPPRMDMYAHNPFTYTDPSFSARPSPYGEVQFSDLPRLAEWVDRYLHKGLPLFLSEWTIPTASWDSEFNWWVEPRVAAKWITDALRLSRRWKRIYALGWIHVYDDPPYISGGLLSANGKPKPGFRAFANG
jgi:hypothetical protein